jgi:hypothetical protein
MVRPAVQTQRPDAAELPLCSDGDAGWSLIRGVGGQICSSKESRFIMPLAHMNLVAVIDLSLNIDHFPLCQNTGIRSCC